MTAFATTDLCDAHEARLASGELAVLAPNYISLGTQARFSGRAATLRVFEDNTLVRSTLEEPGAGRVLVIDGAGSLRCALVGGNLARLAADQGWAGIVVHGCVRDSVEINSCAIGVRALAINPRRSAKRGAGESGVTLSFGGITVQPADWIYSDEDGVLVAREAL